MVPNGAQLEGASPWHPLASLNVLLPEIFVVVNLNQEVTVTE